MARKLFLSIVIGVFCSLSAWADPLCFDPKESTAEDKAFAEHLEKLFTDAEVERALRSSDRLARGLPDEEPDSLTVEPNDLPVEDPNKIRAEKATREKLAESIGVIDCAFLMQRAYRLRAELQLAEIRPKRDEAEIGTLRKAFEKARESFCWTAGHGFADEFHQDLK